MQISGIYLGVSIGSIKCKELYSISTNQDGRFKGISTTHELDDMLHTWLLCARGRKSSHVVLLDYLRAIDHIELSVFITKSSALITKVLISSLYNS